MSVTKFEIYDKILLFLCCTTLYLYLADINYAIIPVIISILLSSLFLYFEDHRLKLTGIIFFMILCIFIPSYIIFLPLHLYNILHMKYQFATLIVPFLVMVNLSKYSTKVLILIALFLFISYLLKYKTDKLCTLQTEYNELRDSSTQISLLLEEKNRSLLQNQDSEIHMATLAERNRISKEIHDNIGHLLSRSLLQVGALLTLANEDIMKEGLSDLKTSLSGGMDQIRASIHQMYDESIDLYSQLQYLVKDFTFCRISFDYDITNSPTSSLKHCFIAIVKEALVNIIRHSNATKVTVILREHPAMYQLIIHDNGTVAVSTKLFVTKAVDQQDFGEGMGLRNISDRIKSFHGNVNITTDMGFQLFITIPKKAITSVK
ncbi:MAG: two-component sensor histidine kinase [Herbinix sp.]|nr:two-component sensor histidine kinase [Herbinix sp.]